MARIPDEVIERIKAEVSLVRLAERYGVALKKHGKDKVGRCPFHEDKTPSLVVSEAKNVFHCFGCDASGTPIDWVMQMEGMSFRHAVEVMQQDLAGLGGRSRPVKRAHQTKLKPFQPTEADQALLNRVIDFYHQTLLQSPEALEYLERRGLAGRELIERFKLGYANRTLGYRLPNKQTRNGKALRTQLQNVGLLRQSGHEHLNGSLVVPVFDEQYNVVQAYGRKISEDLRRGTPRHLYLPGEHRGVFNLEGFQDTEEIIVCEALIDALTVYRAGFKNVTSSYGVNGFTEAMLAAMKDNGIKRALIAYDRDAAGDAAAAELADKLINEGIDCYRLLLPKDMDLNEYACQKAEDGGQKAVTDALGHLIRHAEWMGGAHGAQALTSADGQVIEQPPQPDPPQAKQHFQKQLKHVSEQIQAMDTPAEPLPAKAVPDAPQSIEAEVTDSGITIRFGSRHYRIRGFESNTSPRVMKINLLVRDASSEERATCNVHVDTFDLFHAKARGHFIRDAAAELDVDEQVIRADLKKLLLKLELMQEARLREALQPKDETVKLSDTEKAEALELLKAPDLLNRIVADIEHGGLVGEATNSLVGYLACVSRKLKRPLGLLVQSTSAAGKSSLMEAVLAMMPEEEREQFSAMTGQSLFYMGETNLKHKILAIAEEEGVAQASYALKLLQSEGVLSIASTAKDPQSGRLETQPYRVEGPVMLFLTTTAIDNDEELLNRCLVLSVNESREQTRAIHERQRFECTLEGILSESEREGLERVHQNAQRLLRPLKVVNPYAQHLRFADDKTRTRRDQRKYLTLIESIALLHQHQRPVKTGERNGKTVEYVTVELSDIEIANRLAHEVLGRTLDELPPQTRTLLNLIHERVRERCQVEGIEQADYRFSRREVRQVTGWNDTQLRVHLGRLVSMEYLLVHRGGRGQSYVYELLYDGQGAAGEPFMLGLIDVEALKNTATTESSRGVNATSRGENPQFAGSSRPQRGANAGGSRAGKNGKKPNGSGTYPKTAKKLSKSTAPGKKNNAGRTVVTGRTVVEDEDG